MSPTAPDSTASAGIVCHREARLPRPHQEQTQPFKVTFGRARSRLCKLSPSAPPVVEWGFCSARRQVLAPGEQRAPHLWIAPPQRSVPFWGGGVTSHQMDPMDHMPHQRRFKADKRKMVKYTARTSPRVHVPLTSHVCERERVSAIADSLGTHRPWPVLLWARSRLFLVKREARSAVPTPGPPPTDVSSAG